MCVSVVYPSKLGIRHYYHCVSVFEKLKYQIYNSKNRSPGEMANRLFEKYKNTFMPHGKHMFQTASDMAMAKM